VRQVLPQLARVPIFSGIRRAEVIRQAPGQKLPVVLYAPRHPAADDFRRLAREVDWGLEQARACEAAQAATEGEAEGETGDAFSHAAAVCVRASESARVPVPAEGGAAA
jgi:hypothetical protein